jgi:hypothetical protein
MKINEEKHKLVHTINRSQDREPNPRPLAYGNTRVWFTRGFLAWYWGALRTTLVIELLFCRRGFPYTFQMIRNGLLHLDSSQDSQWLHSEPNLSQGWIFCILQVVSSQWERAWVICCSYHACTVWHWNSTFRLEILHSQTSIPTIPLILS